ncbi:glutamate receptor ionotropic, kainate 3-like [Copidosoma floridanum]|uniref:glutamate receptor ionotropic, kainate 3-like n=1 Tax=Copidosoma floridanum TaxID=29053 RepID=UPI0006C95A7E|nr:glutamate receptor ionotropic, kainate 3-like [Copidosoma floridanum]
MFPKLWLLLAILHCTSSSTNLPKTVIGGIFDQDAFMRKAFSLAVRTMNECTYNRTICDLMHACDDNVHCNVFHLVEFAALVLEADDDLLNVYNKVGELAGHNSREIVNNDYGLAAIVGPHNELSARYIQGLCEIHDLPHIVVRREVDHDRQRSINIYPDLDTLATVYVKMIEKLNWTSFSILYERTEHFLALDKVLKMYGPFAHSVYAFRLGSGPNYSQPLLLAKEKNHKCLIIDCSYERLTDILKQTQEVGMMTGSYKYIITSLDLQTIDLRPYQYSGVNISGIRLIDLDNPFVSSFVDQHLDELDIPSGDKLRTEEALMFDAIALFAQSYKELSYGYDMSGARLSDKYDPTATWDNGLSLRNYILYNSMNGLTGPVMVDSDGCRRRFKLDILNLHRSGLTKVGVWNPDDGFDELRLMNEIKLKHFNVLITMNPPYAMRVNYSKSLEGNDRYEGFVVDIIKELSRMLRFNYTFHVQEDSINGMCTKNNGKCACDGMMGKILSKEMDMAITDLTITEERELCVDFSTAFWNLGMSILYKKPMKAPPSLFSFLSTFNREVWIYLGVIYVLVSLLFFVLGRLCPAEWNNPLPCIDEPRELHNQFTICNSFWFTIGSIMQQGSEIAPIGRSTRTLAGCWWFYCLIIVSTYTANLAAFLTIESPVREVRGIEDLYNQTKIKFGAKKDGSTYQYFESSKNPKHKQLAEQMKAKEWERYMVTNNEDAFKLVRDEKYAFIMESSSIEYIQYRQCDLEQAGPLIDQKSYAIAYAEGFEYHQQISMAISSLQEKLVIKNLYNKWWKEKGVCFDSTSNTPDPMNLEQLAGVFLVLGVGVCLSLVLTIYEFFEGVKTVSKKENIEFMERLSSEAKFITTTKAVKPVLKRNKSLDSNASDYSCNYTLTTQA